MDDDFPERLLQKLGDFCPPLLYACGNSALNRMKTVGYVGSRTIGEEDIDWAEARIATNLQDGYGVVTGGAKGVDSTALGYAMRHGGRAALCLPDNIGQKIRDSYIRQNILEDRLLLYSHISPYVAKTKHSFVSAAMERNKYIYAHSVATVVVRSDLNKGGTWSGATEALRHGWAHVYAWDHPYPGNQKLIELGAAPLSDDGSSLRHAEDENLLRQPKDQTDGEYSDKQTAEETEARQISMFDLMKEE